MRKNKSKNKINYQHKELAGGRWQKLSFFEQMANIWAARINC